MSSSVISVGDTVLFNSEFRSSLPFPFDGVGLVIKVYPFRSYNGYIGDKRYDVLFPIGILYESPRSWLIKMQKKNLTKEVQSDKSTMRNKK